MNYFLFLFILIIFCYLIFAFIMYLSQKSFIFHPKKNINCTPADLELEFQTFYITTKDNEKLHSWYIPCNNSKPTILFCHGNAGNISHRLELIYFFYSLGYSVFIFDYRGYGKSTGTISEIGIHDDIISAWYYLTYKIKVPPSKIILFGRSLGGFVASYLCSNYSPAALILESTFTSIEALASKKFPYLPIKSLLKHKLKTINYIENINTPTLIFHSESDNLVPIEYGNKLYNTIKINNKKFVTLEGAHNDAFYISKDKYKNAIENFIKVFTNLEKK